MIKKRIVGVLVILMFLITPVPHWRAITKNTSQSVIVIYDVNDQSRATANLLREMGYDVEIKRPKSDTELMLGYIITDKLLRAIRPKIEKTITKEILWDIIRITRGTKPSDTLMSWLKTTLNINNINPKIAHSILLTLDILPDNDPYVIITKYGYINLRNSPWKLENWLTNIKRFDPDFNKMTTEIERLILEKNGKIPVHIVAADKKLQAAIHAFESLGGKVMHVWERIYAFWGYIDTSKIKLLSKNDAIGLIEYHHTNFTLNLRISIPQLRIGTNPSKLGNYSYVYNSSTPWGQGYFGDPQTTLVIVDTGIDDTHPELEPYQDQGFEVAKIVYWKDTSNTYPYSPGDGDGHGSHCSGIAAGQGNPVDPYGPNAHMGVAPNISLGGIKIFYDNGSFADSNYLFADYLLNDKATYHIVVASHSWGGPDDATLEELINNLVFNGIVQVVAAGNDGAHANIGSPGSADLAITVGAVNDLNKMAWYSTSGDITTGNTIKPDVTANGGSGYVNDTFSSDDENNDGYIGMIGSVDSNDADKTPGPNNYVDIPGTSMATPHVSGLAGLIIDALGGWNSWNYSLTLALKVKMIILMTAVEFTRKEPSYPGYSEQLTPPLNRGGKDNIEGYGRINADAAIMAITNALEINKTYSYFLGSNNSAAWAQTIAPRAWAGHIYLRAGDKYRITLDVPSNADFDVYVYAPTPDQYGQPILVASGTSSEIGEREVVEFVAEKSGNYYVVVKWIDRSQTIPSIPDELNCGKFNLTISLVATGVPLVKILRPASGSIIYDVVKIEVNATDIDGNVSSLVLLISNSTWSDQIDISGNYNNSSGLYEYYWDTTNVSDGKYNLTAIATDNSGNINNHTIIIRIWNHYPPILLVDDDQGDNYETYYIQALQALGYREDIDYMYWSTNINGTPPRYILDKVVVVIWFTGDDWTQTLVSEEQDALAYYLARCGQLFISGQDIGYDIGGTLWYEKWLRAVYERDNVGIDNVTGVSGTIFDSAFYLLSGSDSANNSNWPDEIAPTEKSYLILYYNDNASIGAAIAYEGEYRLIYFAFPFEAINGSVSRVNVMDKILSWLGRPIGAIKVPENGTVTNVDILNVEILARAFNDINSVRLYVNGTLVVYENVSGRIFSDTYDVNVSSYPDQALLNITLVISDSDGSNYKHTIFIMRDKVPPEITIIRPSNNTYFNTTSVVIEWRGSDIIGIDHYEVKLDDSVWINVGDTTIYTFTKLKEGVHRIYVKALDLAGNAVIMNVVVIVDLTPPLLISTIPMNNTYVQSSSVTFIWNFTDNYEITHYKIRIDNGDWISTTGNNYTFKNLAEGEHIIDVIAYDKAGNSNLIRIRLVVDKTPPSIKILNPPTGSYINSATVIVTWSMNDSSGIDYCEIRIDGSNWINVGNVTSYGLNGLSEGSHTIELRVYDLAGNMNESSVTFVIDTTPPTLSIIQPKNNSRILSKTVTISLSVSDNIELDHIEILVDDEARNIGLTTNITLTLDYGEHSVTVIVFDRAGNSSRGTVRFIIEKTRWIPVDTSILVIALVVLLLSLLVVFWWKKKRRG